MTLLRKSAFRLYRYSCISALFSSLALQLTFATEVSKEEFHYPGREWETIQASTLTPTCKNQLSEARTLFQSLATSSVIAVQDGRILFSYGQTDRASIIESARKSLLSMMYGKYVENGSIDLNMTLEEIGIDDTGGLLPQERQARLQDLLTARSGVFHLAANAGDDLKHAPARGSQAAGSYFLYNNWDFNVAGNIFERLTKRDIYRTFEEDIAQPLQLQDFRLKAQRKFGDKNKSLYMPYHFFLSTRDMARIGYLALTKGRWNNQQIVPAVWLAKSTASFTASSEMHPDSTAARHVGYGYMWWVLEETTASPLHGAYMAWGLQGQYLLIIPKSRMVIAHKRELPVAGNWKAPGVSKDNFLAAARLLATAHCELP
ncbi:serine hydrolase [Undibacterium sp.]|uniref:serine hydrolase domain-containing protein n=1 Tax=Undibacterium sp. TaxID=1914977 RepID=UPI0025E5D52E|nr:serine hydrolase [Undibacterium sp.]